MTNSGFNADLLFQFLEKREFIRGVKSQIKVEWS